MSRKNGLTHFLTCFVVLLSAMIIGCSDLNDIDDINPALPSASNQLEDIYSISGSVTLDGDALAGVTVHVYLAGASRGSALTDENGEYKVGDLSDGETYTVEPSSGRYFFSPESVDVEIDGSDESNINFEAVPCCGD